MRAMYATRSGRLAPLLLVLGCGTERTPSLTEPAAVLSAASIRSDDGAWSEPVRLNSLVNSPANEFGPALSKDGLTLFFGSDRPGSAGLDIWVAHRRSLDEDWSEPVRLGPAVNSAQNDNVPNLSRDQHWLFFASTRPNPSCAAAPCTNDIWASYRRDVHDDHAWEPAVNLGAGVNTAGGEAGPSFLEISGDDSEDSDESAAAQLFFNRSDAFQAPGDIYVSERAADGSFGTASRVDELNTSFSEQRPSIHRSGLTIYFFSNRPGPQCPVAPCSNDIWLSTRESVLDAWSAPVNLGPPINTAGSEMHPHIFSRGQVEELYFVRFVPGTGTDIFVSRRARGSKG